MGVQFKASDLTMDAVANTLQLKGQAIMASGRLQRPEPLAANLMRIACKAQPQFSPEEFDEVLETIAQAVTASMLLSATVETARRVVDEVSDGVAAQSGPSIILPNG